MKCEDTVEVGSSTNGWTKLVCTREHGHPVIGLNHPTRVKKYEFHSNESWMWDERCAWKKGEEPGA